MIQRIIQLKQSLKDKKPIEHNSLRAVSNSLCMLHQATFRQALPDLVAVASITLRGDLILSAQDHPQRAEIISTLGETVQNWGQSLDHVLHKVPSRGDIALGYLTWLLIEQRTEALLRFTEKRLQTTESDPIALWFRGSVLLSRDQVDRSQAVRLLKRALDAGVHRFLPVDGDTRRLINEQIQRQ